MKNSLFFIFVLFACMLVSSCKTVYTVCGFNSAKDAHVFAVVNARKVVNAYANKRIDKMDVSDETKEIIKVNVHAIIDNAFAKIDEIYLEHTQKAKIENDMIEVVDEAIDDSVLVEITPVVTPVEK